MASEIQDESIILRARCHCGSFDEKYSISRSCLPLKSAICGCNSCRKATAQLWASFAVMPEEAVKLSDGSKPGQNEDWASRDIGSGTLSHYNSSKNLVRIFCSTCGASIANFEPAEWELATGVLTVDWSGGGPAYSASGRQLNGLLDRQCLFVLDGKDGGGFIWMPKSNSTGRDMKRHKDFRSSEAVDEHALARDFALSSAKDTGEHQREDDETLDASCHCGNVKFFITRPNLSKPKGAEAKPGVTRTGKWWLGDPEDGNCQKYHALLDACSSCRLVTGFEVNAWTYIPRNNIFAVDHHRSRSVQRQFDPYDPKLNLTIYESTKGKVMRSFCSRCGAPIVCWVPSRDPQIFDLGIGLFSGRGSRCEEWVKWNGIEYSEDAIDVTFVGEIGKRIGLV